MKSPLRKRLPRELKGELGKYLVVFLLMVATIGFVSGYLVTEGSMMKALTKLGIPIVIAMLIMAIYNVVDTFWVARLGTLPVAAVSVVFPLSLLFLGIGLMFGVGGGIEKVNKVLMPVFFLLFVGLGIYVAFQPGAVDGYHYIFRVDGKALGDPKTWIFALGQAFFSLSVAGNGTLIYGSYLSDEENIPAAAGRVAFFDTLAALLASLVIIPAMATTGAKLDQGGPGLLFIFLPNLIKNMPGGKIIVIIFFVAVLFAGLTSLINLYEAPIATVQEKFHLERKPACAVIAVIGVIVSILIQGIVSGWMDVLSIYICPLGAGLAGIMLFWVCGKEYVEKQVNKGRSSHLTSWFYPICKYVYVPVCILVLVLGIALGGIG